MQRTESKIKEVSVKEEQGMVDVMAKFGYNLENRQELQVQDGGGYSVGTIKEKKNDNPFMPNEFFEPGYELEMKHNASFKHYVKLHFARPINIANRDKLVLLEDEFFNLSYIDQHTTNPFDRQLIMKGASYSQLSKAASQMIVGGSAIAVLGFFLNALYLIPIGLVLAVVCFFSASFLKKEKNRIVKELDGKNLAIKDHALEILKQAEALLA